MRKTNTRQLADSNTLHDISKRITSNDTDYISRLMAEAAGKQTFFAAAIMQFTGNLEPDASKDMLFLYLTVWGLFMQFPGCHKTAITKQQYERVQQRNISMFNYLDGEDDNKQFGDIVHDDHKRLNHGAVMQYVSHCFQSRPALRKMDMNDFCVQLIGIKSFIECFEEIAEG